MLTRSFKCLPTVSREAVSGTPFMSVNRYFSVAQIGLLGLPNVGKSTIWNALTKTQHAEASNFAFCTIQPNKGSISISDPLLQQLSETVKSAKVILPEIGFIDVAGLIEGAHEGKGLGNQFLDDLRECDALAHVVRCFQDADVVHVDSDGMELDPVADISVIKSELMLSDLGMLEKRTKNSKKNKLVQGNNSALDMFEIIGLLISLLEEGIDISAVSLSNKKEELNLPWEVEDAMKLVESLGLLSLKPVIYVCNVDENSVQTGNRYSELVRSFLQTTSQPYALVTLSAAVEEAASMCSDEAEQKEFLKEYDIAETGLKQVSTQAYELLKLQSYYTIGRKECRAWNIKQGTDAARAAGKIHSDFESAFVAVSVIKPEDWLSCGGEEEAKKCGKVAQHGRDYVVENHDILNFRLNRGNIKK